MLTVVGIQLISRQKSKVFCWVHLIFPEGKGEREAIYISNFALDLTWLVVEPTHLKNMLVKLEIFPKFRGEKKYLSCHHLVTQCYSYKIQVYSGTHHFHMTHLIRRYLEVLDVFRWGDRLLLSFFLYFGAV